MASTSRDGFGRLTRTYATLEYLLLGSSLETMRFSELGSSRLGQPRSTLILGEGDGRFLSRFITHYPDCTITVIEQSPSMIAAAKKRLSHTAHTVRFIEADLLQHEFDETAYDLIVAHCFFDCFDEPTLRNLICRIAQLATPGGVMWIGDFVEPARIGWRWLQLRILYFFFRHVTGITAKRVVDIDSIQSSLPIHLVHRSTFHKNTLVSSLYRLNAA